MSAAFVAAGSAGVNPQTAITWKPSPKDLIVQAADKGEADAVARRAPFAAGAEQAGRFRVLADLSEDPRFADKACRFIVASGKLVRDNPAAAAAVLRGINKAAE